MLLEKVLFKWFGVVTILHLSMPINLAHAVFGQPDVPLEDYYTHGRTQTGVALINVQKETGVFLGTANLVDLGVDALKGRVMITAAHVLNGMNIAGSSVRFIDENNNSSTMGIQAIHFLKDYVNEKKDIGFIVLDNPVDTKTFKPLKLNLTKSNESLMGSEISIMGCSTMMGHAGSSLVVEEEHKFSLRRGMQTLLRYGTDASPRMNYGFHHHNGLIKITRYPEYALTAQGLVQKSEIDLQLQELSLLIKSNKETGIEDKDLNNRCLTLLLDSLSYEQELIRKGFSQTLVCDETFKNQLATLTDADDLNPEVIIKQWESFIDESIKRSSKEKHFSLEKYNITMYNPLPLLSGISYHGDSGGAWIIGDEIVAISEAFADVKFHELKTIPSQPASDLGTYFSMWENALKSSYACTTPLFKEDSSTVFGTSIWSSKDWIEETLKKIVSDLN